MTRCETCGLPVAIFVLTPAEIAASGARTDLCWGVPGAWCKVPSAGELRARIVELETLLREVYESQPAACTGGRAPCGRCLWCRVRAALDGVPALAPARPVVQCRRCRKWHIHPAPGETRMVCAAVHAPGDCCHYGECEIEAHPTPSEIAAIRREERERAAVRILLADGSSEAEARRVVGDIRAGKKEWDDLSDLDETDRAVVAALGEDE